MHAVEEDAHAFFLLAQALGLVVHLGVKRDDPAVGLLHLGLQLQQGASEVCVLLGQCGGLHLRRIRERSPSRPAVHGERRQGHGEQEGKRPCRLRHRQPIDLRPEFFDGAAERGCQVGARARAPR